MTQKELMSLTLEVLEDETYDLDDYLQGDLGRDAFALFAALTLMSITRACRISPRQQVVDVQLGPDYQVRVHNSLQGSWISVSDGYETAVSRSLSAIVQDPQCLTKDDVKTFVDMLNEAWYILTER